MKDSGIEWFREIPQHWEISKIKYIFESLDHKRIPISAEERGKMESRIYDYYGASGVIDKVDNYIFDEDLILLGEDGANLVTRSKPLAFIARGRYWVNNHAHVLRPLEGEIRYLVNILEVIDYFQYVSGAAQPKLTAENLKNIQILFPPINEQKAIVDFIETKTSKIDTLVSQMKSQIEIWKEYRESIISKVITGKIDVRDWMDN